MPQFSFQIEAVLPCPANDHDTEVCCPEVGAARPALVTLESGIKALIEIVGFAYVEGVPVAIGGHPAKDVDPADVLELGPDGVRLKRIGAPVQAGPIDVKNHSPKVLCLPQRD